MSHPDFETAMRRVITGDDADGRSIAIIDGGPAESALQLLFEIWTDDNSAALDPKVCDDLGKGQPVLSPPKGGVKVRWFTLRPDDGGAEQGDRNAQAQAHFAKIGGAGHVVDQSRHPRMHETPTLDVICLISGDVTLILEDGDVRLKPGNVVIQRATNHAWVAHGGPALLLAVLIDRPVVA